MKNANFLNEFFCENYFCLYLEDTFYSHFLDSVIFFLFTYRIKTDMHKVADSARTERKGSSVVGRDAVYGR